MQIYLFFLKTTQTFEDKRMKKKTDKKNSPKSLGMSLCFFSPINFLERSPSLCRREGAVAVLNPHDFGLVLNRSHQHGANAATSNVHASSLANISWPGQLADPFAMLRWINYGLWPSVPWNMSGCCACVVSLIPLPSQPTCSPDVFI